MLPLPVSKALLVKFVYFLRLKGLINAETTYFNCEVRAFPGVTTKVVNRGSSTF